MNIECRTRKIRSPVLVVCLLVCIGCGGSHESSVSGTAYLDEKPLHTGNVTFYPSEGGPAVYGQIGEDGGYQLSTGSEEGLQPGEYRVTVIATENPPASAPGQAPPIGTRFTPEKYSRPETTDLIFNVEPGSNKFDLRLVSP